MFQPGRYFGSDYKVASGRKDNDKKTPFIAINFKVTHVNENGEWPQVTSPERRTIEMYLSDESLEYTLPKLEKLGFNGDFENPSLTFPESWNGGIYAECRHDLYQGKTIEKWELPGMGGGQKAALPLSSDDIRRLNAVWKSTRKQEQGSPTAPSAPPSNVPATAAAGAADVPW